MSPNCTGFLLHWVYIFITFSTKVIETYILAQHYDTRLRFVKRQMATLEGKSVSITSTKTGCSLFQLALA